MGSGPTPVQSTSFPRTVDARELHVPVPEFDRRTRVLKFATSAFILVLYTVLRLRHLSQYSLWYDEVFSVIAARSSWGEMFRQILIDRVHPPVFYVCLKVWIAVIGDSIVRLRLFSVFFSLVTFVPVWNCLKRTRLSPSISLALLLAIACNPFLIFYAQEVRMYALLGFLAACSLSFYLADDENQTELWLLSVVNVLLVMTHAAGAAVVGCELVHALIARKNGGRYAAAACGPSLLSFASWMFAVRFLAPHPAMVLHNVSWIGKPTFSLAWRALAHPLGGSAALIVLNIL
ncbi:MAG TPA: glycosyltransferase family 39 protein, partial [Terriglobales bacterium]|nr:glycosyltransferase family 39 protein [Terriglobales bacterium]